MPQTESHSNYISKPVAYFLHAFSQS